MKNFILPSFKTSLSKYTPMDKRTFTLSGKIFFIAVAILALSFNAQVGKAQTANALPAATAANSGLSKTQLKETLKKSLNTISFKENKGQWASDVISIGHTNIGDMMVKRDQIFFLSENRTEAMEAELDKTPEKEGEPENEVRGCQKWGLFFEGYNPGFTTTKSNEQVTRYNYFLDDKSKWASDVASFGELTLQNIYNGIDLRLYSQKDHHIEFDWIVNAGVDYHNIKMRFKGLEGLSVDEKGNLSAKMHFDDVKFDIPEAYQIIDGKKVAVKITFKVNGNVASFEAQSKIDNRYALIIDPSLKWGAWFDDNSTTFDEYLFAVDHDDQGNVYCGGAINMQISHGYTTFAYGYDSTYADPSTQSNGSNRDGILYKIKFDGSDLLKVNYYGGNSQDDVYVIGLSPDKTV
ncbi:MAG: domain containing protein, partial [Bacteroidota bacterium]|nr:domain containing protein [Bacteroidota bacterium]